MTVEVPQVSVVYEAAQKAQRFAVLNSFWVWHVALEKFAWHGALKLEFSNWVNRTSIMPLIG